MQSLISVWTSLALRNRILVVGATVAMFIAVMLVARGAAQRDMALLFGGLEPAAAGDVITSLDARGAIYEVRGSAIYVDSAMRDSLRMALAGEGLPLAGAQGYELLDGLSGFGTTSQMFDAAYWRAREGELARTILASPLVRTARVHISTPSSRPFSRTEKPTAAVTLSLNGNGLSAQQVKAFQYLVAAAVSGLEPPDVAVIDDRGGLLTDAENMLPSARGTERADILRDRAERLLAARVGPGNAVVEISVDTISETSTTLERTIDPESRIPISTDVTETEASGSDSRGGDVTVASNLPDGDAGANSGTSSNTSSETRSLTNYEVSQTETQVVRAPGDVRRLTVAVLVNEVVTVADDGTVTATPRSAEELADLEQLVASAVGLNTERGDELTLRSLPFEPRSNAGTEGVAGAFSSAPLNIMQLIQLAVAAIVALILGLFVVRPVLTGGGSGAALPAPDDLGDDEPFEFIDIGGSDTAGPMINDFMLEDSMGPSDAVTRLREMIAERETETVQILQDWMEEDPSREKV